MTDHEILLPDVDKMQAAGANQNGNAASLGRTVRIFERTWIVTSLKPLISFHMACKNQD